MFRKKKGSGDDGGYNRISRMIEERRREMGDDTQEDISEDTIQFNRDEDPFVTDEEDTVSLTDVRSSYRGLGSSLDVHDEDPEPVALERTLQSRWNSPAPLDDADEMALNPEPPAAGLTTPERPATADTMQVPDLGRATANVTLVASDATWDGKLHSDGDVRIEGTVRGEIDTAATLVVAPHARVHASVRARNIMLAGDVEGDITCEERLEILPGGSARGQINSAKLVVHEGAYIDGRFQMRRDGGEA